MPLATDTETLPPQTSGKSSVSSFVKQAAILYLVFMQNAPDVRQCFRCQTILQVSDISPGVRQCSRCHTTLQVSDNAPGVRQCPRCQTMLQVSDNSQGVRQRSRCQTMPKVSDNAPGVRQCSRCQTILQMSDNAPGVRQCSRCQTMLQVSDTGTLPQQTSGKSSVSSSGKQAGAWIAQSVVCWAHCPAWCSVAGWTLLWASGRGDFSLGANMGSDSIPLKLFQMRVYTEV